MPRLAWSSREPSFAAGCLLLATLLWVFGHPYAGIWHDARLYLLAAAHWLSPEHYARDLFFIFGSQDDYTLFSPLYGFLIKLVGGSRAAICVVLSGAVLWLLAHYLLARAALGTTFWAAWFVLLGGMLSPNYSPNGATFILNESFATSRSLAMPLGLLSVWLSVTGRSRWGLLASLLAMAIHPLLGIWAVFLQVAQRLSLRTVGLIAVFGLLAMIFVAWANLPYARLQLMSSDWLAAVGSPKGDVLLAPPLKSRLGVYFLVIAALLLGARFGNTVLRPTYARMVIISSAGLFAVMLTSYAIPVALFVQIQFWRVFWLALPLAILAGLDAVAQTWRGRGKESASVWGGLVALYILLPMELVAPLFLIAATLTHLSQFPIAANNLLVLLERYSRLLGWTLAAIAALLLPAVVLELAIYGAGFFNQTWPGLNWLGGKFSASIWLVPLLGAALLGRARAGHWLVIGSTVVLLPWAFAGWDRRTEAVRAEERCYLTDKCSPHPFSAHVQRGDTVYWKEWEFRVPFVLHAASYVNEMNHAGRVFAEEKFREFARRKRVVSEAEAQGAIQLACRDRELDWVVSKQPAPASELPGKRAESATLRGARDRLIDCRDWRKRHVDQSADSMK